MSTRLELAQSSFAAFRFQVPEARAYVRCLVAKLAWDFVHVGEFDRLKAWYVDQLLEPMTDADRNVLSAGGLVVSLRNLEAASDPANVELRKSYDSLIRFLVQLRSVPTMRRPFHIDHQGVATYQGTPAEAGAWLETWLVDFSRLVGLEA